MRIETHGQQLEVTPALREYVENKLQRIDRHFDQPIEIRVQLGVRKPDHHAEATLNVPGRHDVCFALRTPVIVEAVAAIVLADLKGRGI